MSLIKTFFIGLALAVSSIAVAAPVASAQGTTVIVINEAQIIRDSRAGKDLANKLKNIETQMKNELEPTRKSLETEGQSLQTRAQGKTREAIAADTTLVSQLQAYQQKANNFGQRRNIASQELTLTERSALIAFNKALEPVLKEVVAERSADIVLTSNQVVFNSPASDVTALVISKLDARTPSINVTRQRMPTQAAAQ